MSGWRWRNESYLGSGAGLTLCAAILTIWSPSVGASAYSRRGCGRAGWYSSLTGEVGVWDDSAGWRRGGGANPTEDGYTVDRWETWNAVLRWVVYLAVFSLSLQIGSSGDVLVNFRRALLYFAFGLSIVSVLQFFTSPGKCTGCSRADTRATSWDRS